MSKLINVLANVLGVRTFLEPVAIKEKLNAHEELMPLLSLSKRVMDERKREEMYEEMLNIQKGLDGERQIMYELKNSGVPMLILQDIRIEVGDQSAQIDFVVISTKAIYLIEGKKLLGDIEINRDGDFTRTFKSYTGKAYKKENMYSPYIQNKRHQTVVESFLKSKNVNSKCPIIPIVLLANPKSILKKDRAPKDVQQSVFKSEQIREVIRNKEANYPLISEDKMMELSWLFKNNHKPTSFDYLKKFNLKDEELSEDSCSISIREVDEVMKELREGRKIEAINRNLPSPANTLSPKKETYSVKVVSSTLEDSLKAFRTRISKEEQIAPYMVFSNAEMADIISKRPRNKKELEQVKGFGKKKVEKYGDEIVAILQKY